MLEKSIDKNMNKTVEVQTFPQLSWGIFVWRFTYHFHVPTGFDNFSKFQVKYFENIHCYNSSPKMYFAISDSFLSVGQALAEIFAKKLKEGIGSSIPVSVQRDWQTKMQSKSNIPTFTCLSCGWETRQLFPVVYQSLTVNFHHGLETFHLLNRNTSLSIIIL